MQGHYATIYMVISEKYRIRHYWITDIFMHEFRSLGVALISLSLLNYLYMMELNLSIVLQGHILLNQVPPNDNQKDKEM